MADESKSDSIEQLSFYFPSTDDFDNYDEVDAENGQAELPEDNYDSKVASEDEGCCVR